MTKPQKNIFDYSLQLKMMTRDKMPSTPFKLFLGVLRKGAMLMRQSLQSVLLLLRARRDGVLPLVVLMLRGHPFMVDEDNRLWVYPQGDE